MSTRSQIVIKDDDSEQWFYRHSDGYPEGNLPQLFKFMTLLKEKRIRDNVEQSSGWLILIGAEEYSVGYEPTKSDNFSGWKCGSYEICTCREKHGDIEWFYTIDIVKNEIIIHEEYKDKEITLSYDELIKYKDKWDKIEELLKEQKPVDVREKVEEYLEKRK